jgi:SAM-dependent methyltransferase
MQLKIWDLSSKESLDTFYSQREDPWGTCSIPEKVIRYKELEKLLPVEPMDLALEIACGEGDFLAKISPRVKKAIGMDISHAVLKRVSRKFPHLTFFTADVRTLTTNFLSKFDLIVWLDAIYWISHRNGYEVLKSLAAAAKQRPMYLIFSSRITPLPGTTDVDHWPRHDFASPAEFIVFIRDVFPTAVPIPVQINMNMQYTWSLPYLIRFSRLILKGFIKVLGYPICLKLTQLVFLWSPFKHIIEPFIVHLALIIEPDSRQGKGGGSYAGDNTGSRYGIKVKALDQ